MVKYAHYWILWGAYLLSSLAVAATPNCFTSLNFLSAETEVPRRLIVETYLDLWRALATGKIDGKQAEALLAEKDPFGVPHTQTGDFSALARRMSDFGKLLDLKSWRSREVMEELLRARQGLLGEWIGASRRAEMVTRTAGNNGAQDIALPGAESGVVNRDGGWIYTVASDGTQNRVFAHDTIHNRTTSVDVGETGLRGPYLVPDGSGLYLLREGTPSLKYFPLKNGLPVVGAAVPVAKKSYLFERWRSASAVPVGAAVGKSNHLIVGRYENPVGFYRFDRKSGQAKKLSIPVDAGETVIQWGFVPGTDDLYFLAGIRALGAKAGFQHFALLRAPLRGTGVSQTQAQSWEWFTGTDAKPDSVHFVWRDEGRNAVFGFNRPPASSSNLSAGVLQALQFQAPRLNRSAPIVQASVEIATKIRSLSEVNAAEQVGLSVQSEQEGVNQVLWIDPLKPQETKRGPKLPHFDGFRVSASPEKIFVFGKSGAVQWAWDLPSKPTE